MQVWKTDRKTQLYSTAALKHTMTLHS